MTPAELRGRDIAGYAGRRVPLLTKHGKERVIAPVLELALGCRIELITGFDTDLLGTFTREIPRSGTQLEAARRKARIGMRLAGSSLGLASEGSFGPDPITGMFAWNTELLIWVDDERELEVVGVARGGTNFAHLSTTEWVAAESFAQRSGFPEHQLTVRPQDREDPRIRKGIADWPALEAAFSWALGESDNSRAFLETDVRAHANPSRMENIRLAAEDLAKRLHSRCPACGTPGFWEVERVAGLRCAGCGAPTRETRAEVHGCLTCAHRLTHEYAEPRSADPKWCDYCNP